MPGDYRQNYTYEGQIPPGDAQAAYAATDKAGNQVTIKLVAARDPGAFLHQIQAAAAIVHRNLARVLDWGTDGRYCYVVSERVAGVEIASLAAGRPMDPRTVTDVGEQAAAGLSSLHERGLVHGGVDPHTLVYLSDGTVKVLDFGVRRASGAPRPGASPAGAAPYVSPEVAAGYAPTPASDQYSLGAVLYELAGGRPAHAAATTPTGTGGPSEAPTMPPGAQGSGAGAAASPRAGWAAAEGPAVTSGSLRPVTPLRTLVPDLPFALESAIMRALGPHPDDRFDSMEQMRHEIERTRHEAQAPSIFESPPEVHAQPRRAWPWVVAVIVLLAAIGAGTAYALGVFSGSGPTTPDLVGKTLAQTKAALSDAGLALGTVKYAQDTYAETPDVRVVKQRPAAGSGIVEGGEVSVTLGAGEATVPNVVGLTQEKASAALKEAGLSMATVQSTPSDVPEGQVTSQAPEAGAKVKSGSQVTLTVSAGIETPAVPDVAGKTETAATKTLSKAGFNVKVVQAASATVPAGKVIRQEPTAGVKANKGSTVAITVSTGATASPTAGPTSSPTGTPTSSPTTSPSP